MSYFVDIDMTQIYFSYTFLYFYSVYSGICVDAVSLKRSPWEDISRCEELIDQYLSCGEILAGQIVAWLVRKKIVLYDIKIFQKEPYIEIQNDFKTCFFKIVFTV